MESKNEKTPSLDDLRWEAIASHDREADGTFFYGVKTTGIYCRPGCASRLPKRRNVVFFEDYGEAEAAGFRPCKRCSPEAASPHEHWKKAVLRACELIQKSDELPPLDELASAVAMSPSRLHRLFKEATGVTPKEYAAAVRADRLKTSLAQGSPVTEAIYDAGFNSSSRFYEKSKELLGMTATEYRNGTAKSRLRSAVVDTVLGWMLVAASDRGVCAIELGDDPKALAQDLRKRFPHAELVDDDSSFAEWVSRVTAFIEKPALGLDLPLDIQGTAFQRRVWKALQNITPGCTRTYNEIAREIGSPRAARAVGHACGLNPVALAIPCHRAVRSNGGLAGYRWGIERKRALLAREQTLEPDDA